MRHTRGIQMKGTHHFVAIGALMFLMMTGQALADCVLNGKRLPEGTRIGSLVCEYGQWYQRGLICRIGAWPARRNHIQRSHRQARCAERRLRKVRARWPLSPAPPDR